MSNAKSFCLLAGADYMERRSQIEAHMNKHCGHDFVTLKISVAAGPTAYSDIEIDSSSQIAPESPGLVLFTSCTTGPHKGAVLQKRRFAFQ